MPTMALLAAGLLMTSACGGGGGVASTPAPPAPTPTPTNTVITDLKATQTFASESATTQTTLNTSTGLVERGGGGITLSGTRQTARDAGYATVAGGIGAIGWRELGSATLVATGSVRRTEGDERLFLFADRRREWLTQASVAVTWRRLAVGGIAPLARIGWERNRSSVGLYDYRRVSTELGLSRAF